MYDFQHNERIAAGLENRREKVIAEYNCDLKDKPSTGEYFGIQWVWEAQLFPTKTVMMVVSH